MCFSFKASAANLTASASINGYVCVCGTKTYPLQKPVLSNQLMAEPQSQGEC